MYTEKELIEAVNASGSMRQLMAVLGYRQSGQTAKMLKKKIVELGLEPPKGGDHARRRRELSDILVEDSTYVTAGNLKPRLIRAGHLEAKCYGLGCSVTDEWLGKPITLQLEHVNGVHTDNRVENLILLCPNCHTQTSTWGRKTRLDTNESV